MITTRGRAILLNRLINNQNQPIQNIVLGTGKGRPSIHDMTLEELKVMKQAEPVININNPLIEFKATFTEDELKNCTEIGLTTRDNVLVCRDVFDNTKIPKVHHINITYTLKLNSGFYDYDWVRIPSKNNVYKRISTEKVTGVYEPASKTGYQRVDSIDDLYSTAASYYHDELNQKLYIHTKGVNPQRNDVEIKI